MHYPVHPFRLAVRVPRAGTGDKTTFVCFFFPTGLSVTGRSCFHLCRVDGSVGVTPATNRYPVTNRNHIRKPSVKGPELRTHPLQLKLAVNVMRFCFYINSQFTIHAIRMFPCFPAVCMYTSVYAFVRRLLGDERARANICA